MGKIISGKNSALALFFLHFDIVLDHNYPEVTGTVVEMVSVFFLQNYPF